ncbi:hypothetical protein E3T38_09060 [Cryobacterium sp. Hb1]|nr:hypothetical protein E3T38_09060 [Cryobacterium sp. Hb1]
MWSLDSRSRKGIHRPSFRAGTRSHPRSVDCRAEIQELPRIPQPRCAQLRLHGSSLMIAAVAWLVPQSAEAPALAAMKSDRTVTVTEDATEIVMTPTGLESPVGVFFQPGARVDARAYSAILRPLVESGHLVVIAKQPLGIAFCLPERLQRPGPRIIRSLAGLLAVTPSADLWRRQTLKLLPGPLVIRSSGCSYSPRGGRRSSRVLRRLRASGRGRQTHH